VLPENQNEYKISQLSAMILERNALIYWEVLRLVNYYSSMHIFLRAQQVEHGNLNINSQPSS